MALRFHDTPVRITIIKKTNNNKCWQGCLEKGTLIHCSWECKVVQLLWKSAWRFFKKLKIEPMNSAFLVLSRDSLNLGF
jgi:hypothetical protein